MSTGYGPDCKTFSSESSPLKSDWFQPSIISAKECGRCKREWEVWRHVTMVANFLISVQSFLSEIAICIVERWKKSMTYSFVPESNHHTSRHAKVFVFFLPFTGPRFVEIQRFFYHGNVMKRLLLSIKPCTDFGTVWGSVAHNKERKVAFSLHGLTSCRDTSDVISCNPSYWLSTGKIFAGEKSEK